jgi:hypothetical protein
VRRKKQSLHIGNEMSRNTRSGFLRANKLLEDHFNDVREENQNAAWVREIQQHSGDCGNLC